MILVPHARISEACRYAREHVWDPYRDPPAGQTPERIVDVGPIHCVFTHTRMPEGVYRQLSVSFSDARGESLPPAMVVGFLAALFGFTGEMMRDYFVGVHECECDELCRPNVICAQKLPMEN